MSQATATIDRISRLSGIPDFVPSPSTYFFFLFCVPSVSGKKVGPSNFAAALETDTSLFDVVQMNWIFFVDEYAENIFTLLVTGWTYK